MFGAAPPAWARFLNKLRDRLGSLVDLKPGEAKDDGSQAGSFPITHQTDDTVVFGFGDWHLNFRVVVEVTGQDGGSLVVASTLVRRKHWFGHAYLTLISPFHKMIVRHLLRNVAAEAGGWSKAHQIAEKHHEKSPPPHDGRGLFCL
jgi:hypothetical protein